MVLDGTQQGVVRGIVAAVAVVVAVLVAAVVWPPDVLLPRAPVGDRLAAALRWDIGVLACLIATVGALARHRFMTPADIDGGGLGQETEGARVRQAVLQNTLEQAVVAVLAHLLWAAAAPRAWQAAVPAAVALFVIGCVLFARGYAGGAAARAFGFALTFYPSVVLTGVAAAILFARVLAALAA